MELSGFIVSLIFLSSFILLILGLIKPSIGLFWYKKGPTRQKVLLLYGSVFVFSIYLIGIISPHDVQIKGKREKSVKDEVVEKLPQVSESDLITSYKNKWDVVSLDNNVDFPKYLDYFNQLTAILTEIKKQTDAQPLPKLLKLHGELIKSKKYESAARNFSLYGQPMFASDITFPCEQYLEENAYDPGSLDIVESKVFDKTKTGWKVSVKYRAKNAFGALILKVTTFEVRHDPNESYYVYNASK